MKRLILILLPVLAFAQDTTRTFYFAAPTSYRTMAECISDGLYDSASAPRNPTGYPTSGAGDDNYIPIEKIPWSSITHLVLFSNQGNVSQTAPYFEFAFEGYQKSKSEYMYRWEVDEESDPNNFNWMKMFIDTAHAYNVKILTIIQAVTAANLNYVSDDSTRTQVFVDSLIAFIDRWDFDGVSLNWELTGGPINTDTNDVGRLIRRIGIGLATLDPPGIFEMAPGPGDYRASAFYKGDGTEPWYPRTDVNQYVDMIHLQAYAYTPGWDTRQDPDRGTTWWECGIDSSSFDSDNFATVASMGPNQWVNAGFSRSIMGVLFPALGRIFKGVDSCWGPHWLASGSDSSVGIDVTYQDLARLKTIGGRDTNDAVTRGYAVVGTATEDHIGDSQNRNIHSGWRFFATYMDSANIARGVEWCNTNSITHTGLFSLMNDPALILHQDYLDQFEISEEEETSYSITSGTMEEATVGVAYADTLVGTSPVTADYRILIRGLPPGLWLRWDGVIQGTPTTAGTYTPWVRIQARNTRAKQAWKQLSITINAE